MFQTQGLHYNFMLFLSLSLKAKHKLFAWVKVIGTFSLRALKWDFCRNGILPGGSEKLKHFQLDHTVLNFLLETGCISAASNFP